MSITKEEKEKLLNEISFNLKKINKKYLDVSITVSQLIKNGYVTGKVLSDYDGMKEDKKNLNEIYLKDVENCLNFEDDKRFILAYKDFCLCFNKFKVSLNNLECFSLKLFAEYLKITRTVTETKDYLGKIDVLLDSIYKEDYIFTCDNSYLVFKDRFDVLNERYLKRVATYNEKLLLIMLEQSSDIVLDYYSILCEIYGSVRYLLEDDLYYYCRNNNLQYKM